ncbi:EfeM/EfeO family lipoprotein [Actinomadura rubrisoli]|uniref:EfeM/EfeO family lipoprotein n=1 Tax=Actinomadura rubrisoli TaxID=2530368 RepID=A0A4R5CAW6_9ACTN|nr:EfeM/EfeO family lipoprotein [Actinomadura rubrisoli]TDD94244.1 EfeM/EfeO family lipoprotein [Actinomadura rubrisoli]
MRVPLVIVGAALLLAAAGDGLPARGIGHAPGAEGVAGRPVIDAAIGRCGAGWTRPHAGSQTLLVRNGGSAVAEVTLVDAASGAVFAEIEGLAPGTVRPMRVRLGAGAYAFRCADDGAGDPVTGPPVRIGGPGRGGPAVLPVGENDLYGPAHAYGRYVTAGLGRLIARTGALRAAVHAGDLDAARAAWTPAHLAYERLGAAYGAFGDLDGAINGLPDGLARGVRDAGFTGFHRLEHGLWHGEAMAALEGPADRLVRDVRALRREFDGARVDPADLPLRAHEILEDTLRFQLTGAADQGSGTTLRTAAANLEGTREVLGVLRPVLRPRFPALAEADSWLDRLDDQLRGRSSVDALPRERREKLNGTVGRLVELLASVATVAQPRLPR